MAVASLMGRLVPCAGVTGFYVLIDKLPDPWPGVVPSDKFECLCFSRMSRCNCVVVSVEDVKLDRVILGYVDKAVAEEQSIFVEGKLFQVQLSRLISRESWVGDLIEVRGNFCIFW